MLALDDPQWMDAASRQTLAYAVRRLDGEPVGVLAAVRVGEGLDDPLELAQAFPDDHLRRIEVGPLSVEALGRMLERRLGWVPEGSALFELHTVTSGNPLFALEIARASIADPERSLVVPRSLHEQVSGRIGALSEATRELLVVAAALPRPTLGMIERVVSRSEEALGPAVDAGMVEVQGDVVRFTHPLYASIAYADAREEDRAPIHRAWPSSSPIRRNAPGNADTSRVLRHQAFGWEGVALGEVFDSPALMKELRLKRGDLSPVDLIRMEARGS